MRLDAADLLTNHKHFTEGLMRRFGVASLSERDIEAIKEPKRDWFVWAANGFNRATQAYDLISKHVRPSKQPRHLDIGCGPGYLSTVFASHGYESIGLDLADLSQANENKLDNPHLSLSFHNLNCETDDLSALGKFDVITIDNVIEHVESPTVLVSRLKGLLTPLGVVYLVIPNSQAIEMVKSDPHYGVFGLSLLDRKDGDAVLTALGKGASYEVNNWFSKYDIHSYRGLFAEYDLISEMTYSLNKGDAKALRQRLDIDAFKQHRVTELEKLRLHLPPYLQAKLEYITDLYLFELANCARIGEQELWFFEKSFVPRYLWSSWFFILKRAC